MAIGEDAYSSYRRTAFGSTDPFEKTLSMLTTIMKHILLKLIHFYFPP
jgi:hypothetical protein